MIRIASVIVLLLLMFPCKVTWADEKKWYVPDLIISQTAGYVGYVSLGAGYFLTKRWETDLLFGYVPEFIGGDDIYQISWKNSLHPFGLKRYGDFRYSPIYIGITTIYGLDDDLHVVLPKRYPRGYYPPTALHLAVNLGAEARYHKHGIFIEISALDTGIEAYANNPGFFSLSDITTLAFGYKFYIGKN